MGHITHHAIVVTSYNEDKMKELAIFAREIGADVIGPSQVIMNGYSSLMICPDGGKAGHEHYYTGCEHRKAIIEYMGGRFEWVEIRYGNDDDYAEITNSSFSETVDNT